MLNKIVIFAVSLMLMIFVSFGKAVAAENAAPAAVPATVEEVNATDVTAPAAPAKPAAAPAFPTGLAPIMVGPLEVTPSSVKAIVNNINSCIDTKLFLRIRNTSAADVKIIGFAKTIKGTDNRGVSLFRDREGVVGSGILLSNASEDNLYQGFVQDANKLLTVSPNQFVEIQISSSPFNKSCPGQNVVYGPKPAKTATFSGVMGIMSIDGTQELRPFSISEMPLTMSAQ